jgi:16S rRNA processing protein RimM
VRHASGNIAATIDTVPPDSPTAPAFVTLARLLRPQGRRGELLADLLTDFPEHLSAATGVFLVPAAAEAPPPGAARIVVESHWLPTGKNAGRIVLKFTGTDTINDAERLAHMKLMIPAAERPALDPDTFYVNDLIGCTVYDRENPIGEVIDVEFATTPDGRTRLPEAAPLLLVQLAATPETEPVLIPFVRTQLLSVDTATRRITMQLPQGLVEPPV